ncbi:uncharacterized protein TRIADDRAFT_34124 [Trichoplax adhaerens]|uniref:Uncharacterized protein n=1 Tax=Trichoplax adhaerens TaxID=10228 RepID=B3SDS0_TRIAD|nr:hypothetical protein TRIADDRAFT_34124 [Trichoplax adhaerens]EDV19122.1 hypothetical protein TRIADDRAFT_34124 [Trichoplax adhaerens]|eukprot:XP_002118383.1 hypothetical protein TRIADDRAFT_34124 [Trichoplax adhaerens]
MFSSRIVAADFYLAKPIQKLDACYSDFRRCPTKRVPVVRIFGATPAGQKTCLHVHGVFPYLYVPYDGSLPVSKYLLEFANSIDKAIHVATGVKSTDQDTSNMAWQQVVFKIAIVNGMPMYGYYNEEKQFMKIYLYNPNLVGKVAELLLAGAIMNKVFQPHESHIPFILQFFIDYNLYGMNLIKLAVVKFRAPLNEDSEYFRIDLGINPGIKAIWDDEIQRRKNKGESSQLTPPASQGKID